MPKVLVFENDSAFAATLEQGLAAYDCEVQVVPDGETGITAAEDSPPDIILLTIELPRMNGFSVCNKLKRNAKLKTIPLVLLSSEATSDTFEQHKRLRTRAEEYVHKPIEFSDLMAKIQPLINLQKADDVEELALEEDDLVIEDVEPEAEDETDAAFGNLIAADEASAKKAEEVQAETLELEPDPALPVASVPPPREPSRTSTPPPVRSSPSSLPPVIEPAVLRAVERELAEARGQVIQLESEVKMARSELESEKQNAEQLAVKKGAELSLLQKEVDELRTKLEDNAGAGTAREFLDLREQLNKKDKEIIEIRDLLTSKEKEIVRLNDANIASEREKADQADRIVDLEKSVAALEKAKGALEQDKAQADKRGDDFKHKSERLAEQLEARTSELRQARDEHENELARRDAVEATLREDHRQELEQAGIDAETAKQRAVEEAIQRTREQAAAAQEAALTAAAEEAQNAQEVAILAREKELRGEHDSKMAALHRANEEAMRKLRAEHEQALAAAAQAAAERLAEREGELLRQGEAAVSAQKEADDVEYRRLAQEKAEGESLRDTRIMNLETNLSAREGELEEAKKAILDREGRIAQLEADLAATRADRTEAQERLVATEGQLNSARAKWAEDEASISQARQQLQTAVEALEAALSRPMS